MGSKIHYLDQGQGPTVVFIHGMPTWSYLWRHIVDSMQDSYRCIALDLIGMGRSDKPDIPYTIFDHIRYFDAFMEALDLDQVVLVMHGWGSLVGFDYARRNTPKVRGLAFYEPHVRANVEWDMLSLPVQQLASMLKKPELSYTAVVERDYLVEKLVPRGSMQQLSPEVLEKYREPYSDAKSRKPLWQYVQELPLGDGDDEVVELIKQYSDWLQQCELPKLMLYAMPGFITTIDTVLWARDNLPQIDIVELGEALHFAQETMPDRFASLLNNWLAKL